MTNELTKEEQEKLLKEELQEEEWRQEEKNNQDYGQCGACGESITDPNRNDGFCSRPECMKQRGEEKDEASYNTKKEPKLMEKRELTAKEIADLKATDLGVCADGGCPLNAYNVSVDGITCKSCYHKNSKQD